MGRRKDSENEDFASWTVPQMDAELARLDVSLAELRRRRSAVAEARGAAMLRFATLEVLKRSGLTEDQIRRMPQGELEQRLARLEVRLAAEPPAGQESAAAGGGGGSPPPAREPAAG